MEPEAFWQRIDPAGSFAPRATYTTSYPAAFDDGRHLVLPIRVLPDGERALASLIINQASFAVIDAIATDLAAKLRAHRPDVIVGLPTLGLTLAAAVARALGHDRYVPLGTSRKFWYREELSLPLASITSPDVEKRLYVDPRMLPLLHDRRVVLIDDVISTGASMAAGISLLARCDCVPIACATAMLQSDRWRETLRDVPDDRIIATLRTPILYRTIGDAWTASPP